MLRILANPLVRNHRSSCRVVVGGTLSLSIIKQREGRMMKDLVNNSDYIRANHNHNPVNSWYAAAPLLLGSVGVRALDVCCPAAALIMFLSPMEAMKKIKNEKTTGEMTAITYSSMVINGLIWTTYGLLISNPSVWLTNSIAFILGSYYVYIFNKFRSPSTKMSRHFGAIGFCATAVTICVGTLPEHIALNVLGVVGDALVVVMFAGPLAVAKNVIATKSTASLPFGFTIASLVNCTLWTVYGTLVIQDIYIWLPNMLGVLSSLIQLSLFAIYGFGEKNVPSSSPPPPSPSPSPSPQH